MKEKYYRVRAEVNLKTIHENLENVRKKINPKSKLMVIIKADAYGHGATETAKATDDIADAYGVAIYEEGIQLRDNGITKPILLLGYTSPAVYDYVLEYDLTPTIFTLDDAKELNSFAADYDKVIPVHIALDTGMSRIGFAPDENSAQREYLLTLPVLIVLIKPQQKNSLKSSMIFIVCSEAGVLIFLSAMFQTVLQ